MWKIYFITCIQNKRKNVVLSYKLTSMQVNKLDKGIYFCMRKPRVLMKRVLGIYEKIYINSHGVL